MYEKIKYHVFDVLVETDDGETIDRIVAVCLMILILINAAAVVLETVDEYNAEYGDNFPMTALGKLLGGFIAFLGIGMFALPTGILASGFAEEIARRHRKAGGECCCPNCGCDISADFEKKK